MMRISRSTRLAWLSLLSVLVLAAGPAAGLAHTPTRAPSAIITVNTTADGGTDGFCSLREAIQAANTNTAVDGCPAGSGADIINFSIGTGLVTITLSSAPPAISSPVFLDGTTQPGYAGTPIVRIDYSIRSLLLSGASNTTIRALDLSYYHGGNTGTGIAIVASANVTVTNIIAANRNGGIDVNGTSDVRILGNDLRYAGFGGIGAIKMYSIPANLLPGGVLLLDNRFGNSQYGLNLSIMTDLVISDGSLPGSNIVLSDTCGLTQTSATAMSLFDVDDSTIAGVDLSYGGGGNGTRGLDLYNSANVTVTGVTAAHRNGGIFVSGGQDVRILDSDLHDAGFGGNYALSVSNVAAGSLPRGVLISDNLFGNSQYGLRLAGLTSQRISDGSLPDSNVVLPDANGLNQTSSTGLYLDNLSDSTAAGLDLSYTGSGNGSWGLYVNNDNNLTITQVLVAHRNWGIFVSGGSDIRVLDSDLRQSGYGSTYALVLWNVTAGSLPGGVLASGNLFGQSENGIQLQDLANLRISDGLLPGSNVILEPGSGLDAVSAFPLYLNRVATAIVDGVDLSYNGGGNSGAGLNVQSTTNLTVTHIAAANRMSGVAVEGGQDVWVLDNDLRNSGYTGQGAGYALSISSVAAGALPNAILVSGNLFAAHETGVRLQNLPALFISDVDQPGANVIIPDGSGLTGSSFTAMNLANVPYVTIDGVDFSFDSPYPYGYGLRTNGTTALTLTHVTALFRAWAVEAANNTTVRMDCTTLGFNGVGIYLTSAVADTILNNNHFEGNTNAVYNGSPPLVNAEYNWWGAPDGPGNLGGSGDTYLGNVDAEPWLTEPPDCGPALANLEITKTVQPAYVEPGDPLTYTILLTNNGPETATGVLITDIVPAAVIVQDVQYGGVAITDTGAVPPYVWQVQDLAPWQDGSIVVVGVLSDCLPAGYDVINTAYITGTTVDPMPGNNAATATLIVPNATPVAHDDAYVTSRDNPLYIPAPGVLANDTDANCGLLTAVLVTDVTTGTLTLYGDGSFDYLPDPLFTGTVTFTYLASDGPAQSNIATVTLSITGTCTYGVAAEPPAADGAGAPGTPVGYTLRVTNTGDCSDILDVVVGGNLWPTTAPAIVGPLAPGAGSDVAVTVDIPAGAQDGEFDVVLITFTSAGDDMAWARSTLTTTAVVTCTPVTQTAFTWSPLTPTAGQAAVFTGTAQGTAPITYAWSFGDGGTGSGAVVTHIFATAGTYVVTLTAENGCAVALAWRPVIVVAPAQFRIYLPLVYKVQAP